MHRGPEAWSHCRQFLEERAPGLKPQSRPARDAVDRVAPVVRGCVPEPATLPIHEKPRKCSEYRQETEGSACVEARLNDGMDPTCVGREIFATLNGGPLEGLCQNRAGFLCVRPFLDPPKELVLFSACLLHEFVKVAK